MAHQEDEQVSEQEYWGQLLGPLPEEERVSHCKLVFYFRTE
jgi:hypothetical protein